MLGGTNSLHTNALDETLALPSEQAAEIALRTQQVIMEETGVVNVADPLGGSWYVEALTDKIEAEAYEIFDRILAQGGSTLSAHDHEALAAVTRQRRRRLADDQGHPARHRGRLVHGRDRRGGVPVPDRAREGREADRRRQLLEESVTHDLEILRVSHEVEVDQVRELGDRRKATATTPPSTRALARLVEVARTEDNMIPAMLEACRVEATLGEICDALRAEWGEYREPARF